MKHVARLRLIRREPVYAPIQMRIVCPEVAHLGRLLEVVDGQLAVARGDMALTAKTEPVY